MLPDNFDFAMLPDIPQTGSMTLSEIGMLKSDIENIDYAITSWLKIDLSLEAKTNEGRKRVPVLWQTPERAFQIKNNRIHHCISIALILSGKISFLNKIFTILINNA